MDNSELEHKSELEVRRQKELPCQFLCTQQNNAAYSVVLNYHTTSSFPLVLNKYVLEFQYLSLAKKLSHIKVIFIAWSVEILIDSSRTANNYTIICPPISKLATNHQRLALLWMQFPWAWSKDHQFFGLEYHSSLANLYLHLFLSFLKKIKDYIVFNWKNIVEVLL